MQRHRWCGSSSKAILISQGNHRCCNNFHQKTCRSFGLKVAAWLVFAPATLVPLALTRHDVTYVTSQHVLPPMNLLSFWLIALVMNCTCIKENAFRLKLHHLNLLKLNVCFERERCKLGAVKITFFALCKSWKLMQSLIWPRKEIVKWSSLPTICENRPVPCSRQVYFLCSWTSGPAVGK